MLACLLTDNTAHLPHGAFPGQRLIKSITMRTENQLLATPTADDFLRAYSQLECEFHSILVLTCSSHLFPIAETARQAASRHGGAAHISVMDSQQTGAGLGLLAQIGAQAAAASCALPEIERRIRAAMPHIYTLIHAEAENLSRHGRLGRTPAALNETYGSYPLFALENGQLAPYKKVRTKRHLLESFQEFIEEFEAPQQIAFLRAPGNLLRARPLRETAQTLFPHTPFGEIEMSAPLMMLFGSQAVGLTVMEMPK